MKILKHRFCCVLLWFCILVLSQQLNAQWTLSEDGSIITQTGQSTLEGLQLIEGVNMTVVGQKKYYKVTGNRIVEVYGELSIDPRYEALVFEESNTFRYFFIVYGMLNIGIERVENGHTYYSTGDALIMPKRDRGLTPGNFIINETAQLNWRGGRILSGNASLLKTGGKVEIWDGTFLFTDNDSSGRIFRNRGGPNELVVHHITLDSDFPPQFGPFIHSMNGTQTFSATVLAGAVQNKGGTHENALLLQNMSFQKNRLFADVIFFGSDIDNDFNQAIEITNLDVGTAIRTAPQNESQAKGHLALFQEIKFSIVDCLTGDPIVGAIGFVRSTDHGDRQNPGTEKFRNYRNFLGPDYNTYSGKADAQGETPIMKILTGTKWTIDNPQKTFYGNTSVDGEDKFTFHFWDYAFAHSKKDVDLHHKDVISEQVGLVPDTNITETNKAMVAAYTSIDNLDQLYDYAKYWKTLEAHIEIPAIDQQLITGDSNTINFGDYNLVLDHTAANVITVVETQKTIIIKSGAPPAGESAYRIARGTRFTELITTGTVSAANGDQIEFGYTDSVGSHFYTEIKNLSNTYVSINDHLGVTDDSLGVEISATDTPINGSYKVSLIKPSDDSDIRITLTQTGYNDLTLRYPLDQLSFSIDPIMTEAAVDFEANQQMILVYLFKLLQKTEALRNRYRIAPTPSMTVTTTANTETGEATIGNQEKALHLLQQILLRLVAVKEAAK